jgi:hypothetical protein
LSLAPLLDGPLFPLRKIVRYFGPLMTSHIPVLHTAEALQLIGALILQSNSIENMLLSEIRAVWVYRNVEPSFVPESNLRREFDQRRKTWMKLMTSKLSDEPEWISKLNKINQEICKARDLRDLFCHCPVAHSFEPEAIIFREKSENPQHIRLQVRRWIQDRKKRNQPVSKEDPISYRRFIERLGEVERHFTLTEIREIVESLPRIIDNLMLLHGYASSAIRRQHTNKMPCKP